ncbi:MAG: hypothetical protein LAP38_28785 [Acidobacteriia bacterium]|nr:hypothetical protein [Terriglobia bacterium]
MATFVCGIAVMRAAMDDVVVEVGVEAGCGATVGFGASTSGWVNGFSLTGVSFGG